MATSDASLDYAANPDGALPTESRAQKNSICDMREDNHSYLPARPPTYVGAGAPQVFVKHTCYSTDRSIAWVRWFVNLQIAYPG